MLYFDKICEVGSYFFGNGTTYDREVCLSLDSGNYTDIQTSVQKQYASLYLISQFLQVSLLAIMSKK